jgi:hypothetical protein
VNRYAISFRWAVGAGVLANMSLAVPATFTPNSMLRLIHTSESLDPKWTAFAAWLLVLLSLFYIPAALDPFRYRPVAVLSVSARAAGVIFFFGIYAGRFTVLFGLLDLTFLLVEGPLLFLALRTGPTAGPVRGALT